MGRDEELELRIVVAEGIATDAEARALGKEAARKGEGILERLRADGRISGATFASLRARVGAQDEDPTAKLSPADLGEQPTMRNPTGDATWNLPLVRDGSPSGRFDPEAFPVPGWDRYESIRLLGQGGMGRVFLAKDLRLGRNVAIKFMRGDDPEFARRIVAEARAQARVNDDRVCKVYEVGEVRGRVYIAMQHIDGKPVSELAGELSYEEKAIVVRGAALGIAEAHRAGLIHRDIKPSNIMVERGADGELRPFVMDFGLARDWAESTTMTGTVLGTPQYMSPEQALGEVKQLDRRADVYSLGATLYALLTAQPPIEGSNPLVVLSRVKLDEPRRPRAIDPDVPADLEAITMKCLEKDRTARYDSARALADDLGRFLAGEPVEARASAGLGYRLRKTLRRHARLIAGLAVVAAVVAVAIGLAVRASWRAERRVELARRFTEKVERIELIALSAALSPVHDLRTDRARLRVAMDELAAEVRAGGDLAAGPGRYALGRGHLALDDHDLAAAELATAWARGYQEPRVAYALALAEGHRYQRALRELERSELSKEQRVGRRRELEQRHRDPALRALRASGGVEAVSPAYVAALLAFYEDRFDVALAQLDALERSGAADAWFYEASLLRGEVLHARAEARLAQGAAAVDREGAAADREAARRALAAAAAIGRSVPAVHRARAELELTALWRELYGGSAVDAPFKHGLEATGLVLALLPDDAGTLTLRARLRRLFAAYRQRQGRGEDAAVLRREAVADAKRALELDPAHREARFALVDIYKQWADENQDHGRDPSEQLGQAVAFLESIPASDRDADFHLRRGLIHGVWADYQDGVGQDSSAHRSQAISAYEQAVQKDARLGNAWLSLCKNYTLRAARSSKDPDGDLVKARDALARGRELDPTNFLTYLYEGNLYAQLATLEQDRGRDPASTRARAIERYREGLAVTKNKYFHIVISDALLQHAQEARRHGRDPLPLLDEAEAAARQAVAAAPDDGYGYLNIGIALLMRADYQQARDVDPVVAARAARAAEEAFQHAALEPLRNHPALWRSLVDLHLLLAKVERDRDPGPRVKLAEEALLRARDLSEAEEKERRGQLRALLEQWQVRQRARAAGEPAR